MGAYKGTDASLNAIYMSIWQIIGRWGFLMFRAALKRGSVWDNPPDDDKAVRESMEHLDILGGEISQSRH